MVLVRVDYCGRNLRASDCENPLGRPLFRAWTRCHRGFVGVQYSGQWVCRRRFRFGQSLPQPVAAVVWLGGFSTCIEHRNAALIQVHWYRSTQDKILACPFHQQRGAMASNGQIIRFGVFDGDLVLYIEHALVP